ncbi:MAG: dihydrolipoyl dehydrogenase [Candidatus Sericytochromatia bacterium]|nr:dihydrolipoyl dehydrogenase [Candidatus Sericytochromatia bacterium]
MVVTDFDFDLAVLGAGSAGYWAARTAGSAGARVALIDPGPLGGLCILRGCMPTKALLRSTDVLHLARHASTLGVEVGPVGFDFARIMARKAHWVEDFARYRREGIESQQGFEWIQAAGRFLDAHTLQAGDRRLTAKAILVATGSRPWAPPIPGLAEAGYWTSDDVLALERPPRSLIVMGGGVIALELGQFMARLGVETTLAVRAERVLASEDGDVSAEVARCMLNEGIRLETRLQFHRVTRTSQGYRLEVERDGTTFELEAEALLVATGRVPAVEGLDLDAAGVHHLPQRIPVDAHLRTSTRHIYAVGDAASRHQLVHVAIAEGTYAARHALGEALPAFDDRLLAWAIFCDPNVARVGRSEAECRAAGIPHVVGTYPFNDQGKALVANLTDGFVKVIAHRETGEILGAAVVGAEGADLIHEMIVAMYFHSTCRQFLEIPHLHPTLAEIWLEPVEACEEARQSACVAS